MRILDGFLSCSRIPVVSVCLVRCVLLFFFCLQTLKPERYFVPEVLCDDKNAVSRNGGWKDSLRNARHTWAIIILSRKFLNSQMPHDVAALNCFTYTAAHLKCRDGAAREGESEDFHFNGVGEARSQKVRAQERKRKCIRKSFFFFSSVFLCRRRRYLLPVLINLRSWLSRRGKSILCAHQKLIISSFPSIASSRSLTFFMQPQEQPSKGNKIRKLRKCLMARKFFYDIPSVENR